MILVTGPIRAVEDPQWQGWQEGRIKVTQRLLKPQDQHISDVKEE